MHSFGQMLSVPHPRGEFWIHHFHCILNLVLKISVWKMRKSNCGIQQKLNQFMIQKMVSARGWHIVWVLFCRILQRHQLIAATYNACNQLWILQIKLIVRVTEKSKKVTAVSLSILNRWTLKSAWTCKFSRLQNKEKQLHSKSFFHEACTE